ncbi:metal ABC transporter solute-binding protein, Zn/Mn family [Reyranella sp.]|uniref:metal ABC transporter solute-binding protein, Zn/Mn family n=1 Tax=Reyranella sp. TaxID=1929291 RepID=UPI003D0A2E9D
MRIAFFLAALLIGAAPALADPPLKAVATFSILGDFVREVGGDRIDLATLVGPDADAHTYQPKPADARLLARAQVLVSNGLGFEGWIDRLAEAAGFKGRRIVASAGATPDADPHCWQDVGCARRYVANIANGLAAADPANAAGYRARAAQYDQRLAALDDWIRREIATIPAERRQAITGHSSFRYFSRAYAVRFDAPRGYSTDSEPTARDVANLIRQVREQKTRALFIENMTNPALIAEIARDSGAAVGPRLYSDALSKPGGPAPTYEAMMRHNVAALVEGMRKN